MMTVLKETSANYRLLLHSRDDHVQGSNFQIKRWKRYSCDWNGVRVPPLSPWNSISTLLTTVVGWDRPVEVKESSTCASTL